MPGILLLFIVSIYCVLLPAHAADWDPFRPMARDSQNIVIPSAALGSTDTAPDNNDWPQASPNQWQEDKDAYVVTMPLQLPEDADNRLMTYKYSNGNLKVTIPKRKFKSII